MMFAEDPRTANTRRMRTCAISFMATTKSAAKKAATLLKRPPAFPSILRRCPCEFPSNAELNKLFHSKLLILQVKPSALLVQQVPSNPFGLPPELNEILLSLARSGDIKGACPSVDLQQDIYSPVAVPSGPNFQTWKTLAPRQLTVFGRRAFDRKPITVLQSEEIRRQLQIICDRATPQKIIGILQQLPSVAYIERIPRRMVPTIDRAPGVFTASSTNTTTAKSNGNNNAVLRVPGKHDYGWGSAYGDWDQLPLPSDLSAAAPMIAILDTGVDRGHTHFASESIVLPPNFYAADTAEAETDTYGHGTCVAGIIAGVKKDTLKLSFRSPDKTETEFMPVGCLPGAKLYSFRVTARDDFEFKQENLAKHEIVPTLVFTALFVLRHYLKDHVRVVNASLSYYGTAPYYSWSGGLASIAEQTAFDALEQNRISVVACAGNFPSGQDASPGQFKGGSPKVSYPARYDPVISVGAHTEENKRASFSSFSIPLSYATNNSPLEHLETSLSYSLLSLSAPGKLIICSYPKSANVSANPKAPNNEYALMSGTSFAAPFITAAAAWLYLSGKSNNIALNTGNIRYYLRNSTEPLLDDLNVSTSISLGAGAINCKKLSSHDQLIMQL